MIILVVLIIIVGFELEILVKGFVSIVCNVDEMFCKICELFGY